MATIKHGRRTGSKARSGPPSPENKRAARVHTFRLTAGQLASLDAVAARLGASRSAAVVWLIEQHTCTCGAALATDTCFCRPS